MPQRIIETYQNGVLVTTTPYTITQEQENEEIANSNIQAQAQAAITALRDYRALGSPTQPQTVVIVRLLCLCMIRLIRLVLRRYDEVD